MDFFIRNSDAQISQRKIEGYLKLAEIIQWGRKSPIKFCEQFLGIQFLDAQKYTFMNSWLAPYNLWCITRNGGKSTLSAPFIMAKGILISGHNSYILSNVSAQSQDTFLKIEKIAKKEISSFTGLTDFFMGELVKSAANTDGFTHSQSGFNYKLYNGSSVTSLSGDVNNNRGKRSSLNVYDESGWTSEEYVVATIPFLLQNSTFRLGGKMDVGTFPKQIPNQRLFISSASSTDSYFYMLYKDYSKRMFMGDKNYFVSDLNCEVMINATFNGKKYPVSLINKDEISAEMRKNKEKALREFYNKFSVDGGDKQVFKRATIVKNSVVRLPVIKNTSKQKRMFVMAYDPAHDYDNSVCMIGEIIEDANVGYRMEICGGVSFVDIGKKKKTPMRTPEQIKQLKRMILDLNGEQKADYENIECLLIDSGAGGHGTTIADYLMEDWTDDNGITHKGFIDSVECKDHVHKFPNAVDKLKLMSPQKYKKEMYDALVEMMNLDLISFTSEYSGDGYLMIPVETGKEIEVESTDQNGNLNVVKEKEIEHKKFKLDFDEELALRNIDLAKEELVNIYRETSANNNYRYDLSKDKENKMNDDRAYCMSMLGWYLQQLRRDNIINKPQEEIDIFNIPTQVSSLNITL
ncbi:terminase [Bacillus xiapuensis]|uniref:Terminase n=1 Tax=Bacillus xiapuensis TaxID=2014075 RepID=A0ABU6N7S5_9BACI|nr:terminase [Bacillus xiapuensis]